MAYNLEDRVNIIYLRNQLINAKLEQLLELYKDDKSYGFFIDTLNIAMDAEPAFFLLDGEILEKAMSVVYAHRFEFKDPTYSEIVNEIITAYNELTYYPDSIKIQKANAYIIWQSEVHDLPFYSKEDLLACLAHDALTIHNLANKDFSNTDPAYFLASINYLVNVLPEFFEENADYLDLSLRMATQYATEKGFRKRPQRAYAKKTIKNIQKVKAKEE